MLIPNTLRGPQKLVKGPLLVHKCPMGESPLSKTFTSAAVKDIHHFSADPSFYAHDLKFVKKTSRERMIQP